MPEGRRHTDDAMIAWKCLPDLLWPYRENIDLGGLSIIWRLIGISLSVLVDGEHADCVVMMRFRCVID